MFLIYVAPQRRSVGRCEGTLRTLKRILSKDKRDNFRFKTEVRRWGVNLRVL